MLERFNLFAWWRDLVRRRDDARAYRKYGELVVAGDALERRRGQEVLARLLAPEIVRIEMYKVDLITTDDICCDIHLQDGAAHTFDEETPGWDAAIEWLESLPGFRRSWRNDVVLPPFAECRQVVFIRNGGSSPVVY